jgi:hypothetical protein
MSEEKKAMDPKKGNLIAGVIILSIIVIPFIIAGFSGSSKDSEKKTATKTVQTKTVEPTKTEPTPTPTPKPKTISIGDEVLLNYNSDKNKCDDKDKIVLGVEKKDFDQIVNSVIVKDNYGIAELVLQGRAFMVDNCTKARYIDIALGASKVRILEGDASGEAGWTMTEWLHSIDK